MTDIERFDRMWRDNCRAVLRYAQRRVSSSSVDDVVAETFVVAWRRLDEVPEFALPWLLAVARGVAANAVRGSRRQGALVARLAAEPAGIRADSPVGSGVAIAALRRLSSRDQELLTLIAWDGLEPHEAAEVLGCSAVALRVRLHRARTRFKEALAVSTTTPLELMEK